MSHDQRIVGLMILALIAVGLGDTLWHHRAFWRGYLTAVRAYWLTPVYAGAHRAEDLPRPGVPPLVSASAAGNRATGPGWNEDDAETLTWMASLHHDPDLTVPFQAFRDPPAGSHVLVPVQDGHVSVTYEPPVDLPRPECVPPASPAMDTGPGQPFHPHAGPADWHRERYIPVTGRWVDPQPSWWQRCGATSRRDWRQHAWQEILMACDGPRQLTA